MTEKELEKIYTEAYKPVYWTAMQLLKNEADAEDVVQDTFVAFLTSYEDMKDTSKAVALLKKIAANKCLDRIKLAKTDNMEDEFFDSIEAVAEDFLPDSIVESEDARKIVMDIISNSLSEDIRRTLILFYFDELSTKEIADMLEVPEGTVRRRLNFARNKIKKEVEKYENENNTKLFVMALPFLSKLFMKEAEQVEFKPMPASFANLSAAVSTQIAKEVAKKGTEFMVKKIVFGSVAAALVTAGATAGIAIHIGNKLNPKAFPTEAIVTSETGTEETSGPETTRTEGTTTTEESTTEETTTSEETTALEETSAEETASATAAETTAKKPTSKPSPNKIPKGWTKVTSYYGEKLWGRKYGKFRIYIIRKGKKYKGFYKGQWRDLYNQCSAGDEIKFLIVGTDIFYLNKMVGDPWD